MPETTLHRKLNTLFSTYLEPICFGLYFVSLLYYLRKVDRSAPIIWLCVYYGLATVLMARVSIGFKTEEVNTHFYNLHYLITGVCMGGYFYCQLERRWKKALALALSLGTTLYYILNSVVGTQPYFDSLGYTLVAMGIVILLFLHLHQLLQHITDERLFMNFAFWFSCVLLFYYLGAFAIFLSYNYFTHKLVATGNSHEIAIILTYLWIVHNVILFLGGLVTAYGMVWISRRKFTSS